MEVYKKMKFEKYNEDIQTTNAIKELCITK